ncbi:hypothetical protein SASPL_156104 [Salvia splendens]|uniref:glycerophosphodiester phosphodiesterase n=1 Tax=Salvia splendens TaxID=180675 RepID=A0A8X8VXF3_SALSN|nr:hypothetical protein SASPL_156104 [Salvia splendens]
MVAAANRNIILTNLKDLERVNSDLVMPSKLWLLTRFLFESVKQRIYSRAPNSDSSPNQILTIEDMVTQILPPGLWLSVPHDAFFSLHNQSMRSFIISVSKETIVSYISSPEVGFLKSVASRFRRGPTKLVFQLLVPDEVEPTTNQTYGASSSVDCYAHMSKNDNVKANVLVISNEGASGDFPGCTDRAYQKAVSDGVDILDCPVQITNDGIPFCLGSINLRDRTTVAQSDYIGRATDNPDLSIEKGIFAYNLHGVKFRACNVSHFLIVIELSTAISNPYSRFSMFRNPKAKNDGKLMQLSDFLAFANTSSVSGVIISIENAAYLAEKQGLGVTDVVLDTLSKAGFNNQTGKKVMIRSSDSAALSKFKSSSKYELVYLVDEDVRDILNSTILEIKKFASSVVVSKKSVFPTDDAFATHDTIVVPKLQAYNLSVYVQFFRNEFVSHPWDFFSDPYVEINSHHAIVHVSGDARHLIAIMAKQDLPLAEAPNPVLTADSVVGPPLPPTRLPITSAGDGSTAPGWGLLTRRCRCVPNVMIVDSYGVYVSGPSAEADFLPFPHPRLVIVFISLTHMRCQVERGEAKIWKWDYGERRTDRRLDVRRRSSPHRARCEASVSGEGGWNG